MNHAVCLHEHGVLHNDLEPRNVVIADGELRLIDFGLSELGHCCSGPSHCLSLLQLQDGIRGKTR
jgi:tRNA A-37 threonylcarbamoyl transferase component Bud32